MRPSRCDHCGRLQSDAEEKGSTHCAPPFSVVPHSFTGKHPSQQECDHDYRRAGSVDGGWTIIYECSKCGDEYEKDVS